MIFYSIFFQEYIIFSCYSINTPSTLLQTLIFIVTCNRPIRYPGTTFMDHIQRYHDDPEVKLLVVLGEVGGTEEYDIIDAIKNGRLSKPIIAWCIGTCARMFTSEARPFPFFFVSLTYINKYSLKKDCSMSSLVLWHVLVNTCSESNS